MKTLYVVIARSGKYEDAYDQNIRAFDTRAAAAELIKNYVKWLKELSQIEEPEGYEIDWEADQSVVDEQCLMQEISSNEFWEQCMNDEGIPPDDRPFLFEHKSCSGDDIPNYKIQELEYQE